MTTTKDTHALLWEIFSRERAKHFCGTHKSCVASPLFVRAHTFQTLSFRSKERERPVFFRAHNTQSSSTALEFWTHIERERETLQNNARGGVLFSSFQSLIPHTNSSKRTRSGPPPFLPPVQTGARRRRFEEEEEEEEEEGHHVAPPARRRSRPLCCW